MKIDGMVHCLFEQSGTFKNEFKKLGIPAADYDILNDFGETDYVIDLFREIEDAYAGEQSMFDYMSADDLVVAFFPCIYFSQSAQTYFRLTCNNTKRFKGKDKFDYIIDRADERNRYYKLLIKLCAICILKGIRLVFENPITQPSYLINNFLKNPDVIDNNRMLRGDFFRKPTGYWFFNCEPTNGFTMQNDKEVRTIKGTHGVINGNGKYTDRSMISPDYARNWICDFILGKEQTGCRQESMFSEVEI